MEKPVLYYDEMRFKRYICCFGIDDSTRNCNFYNTFAFNTFTNKGVIGYTESSVITVYNLQAFHILRKSNHSRKYLLQPTVYTL